MNWTFSGWCCQESEVSGETGEVCSRGHQAERISHVTSMTFFSTAVFIQMYCWFPNTITNIDKAWFWSASEKYLLSLQLLFAYTSCHTICAAPRSSVGTLIVSCLSCPLPTSWAGRHSVVWEALVKKWEERYGRNWGSGSWPLFTHHSRPFPWEWGWRW